MSLRTFLYCEDDAGRIKTFAYLEPILKRVLSERMAGTKWEVVKAGNYEDALNKSRKLQDEDIVSLDSRLNDDMSEGERILASIRERNCKCFALWHSPTTDVPRWAEQSCYKLSNSDDDEELAEEIAREYERWQKMRDTVSCRQPNFSPAQNLTAIYSILKAMELFPHKRVEIQKGWEQANADWRKQLWKQAWHEFNEEPKRDAERWSNLGLPTFEDSAALNSKTLELEQTDLHEAVNIIKSVLPR